jgi:hypothetical protein
VELKKSTVIECVASTSDRDVANESLDIEGADITPLLEGRGFCNSDHRNDFAHLVGRVMEAKKIMKAEDCKTASQMKYWSELRKPFIWCKAEVWDGHGHKEADSIASIYKFYQSRGEEAPIKVSVEGKTLERGANGTLKRTLIKGIALTVAPCNRKTRTDVVMMTKSLGLDSDSLIKNEDSIPSFVEMTDGPIERINQLVNQAKDLLAETRKGLSKSDEIILKSPALLEQVKLMTLSLTKK